MVPSRHRPSVVVVNLGDVAGHGAGRSSPDALRPSGEPMKMCSISVLPMPSRIFSPVFACHSSQTALRQRLAGRNARCAASRCRSRPSAPPSRDRRSAR